MKKTTTIEIDIDVYKAIIQNSEYINEAPNDVLRRMLLVDNPFAIAGHDTIADDGGMSVKNVFLPNGMKLRKQYKGKVHKALVKDGFIALNEHQFTSPSGAAVFVAKNQVNGWKFWEYFDSRDKKWKMLETLREKSYD
ncbi:MAG: DUF4357 domain-containing protein [Chitinophagaceae bacterium]|nr:DUF4357 domain-containing protein [Chitinophagaceae bacterium]